MASKKAFQVFDKRLQSEIRTGLRASGVVASGKSSRELRSEIGNTKYKLFGVDYYQEIDKGRGPNRTNSGGLRAGIYEWLQYKKYGFNWKDDKERASLSFAISRSIAKKGSFKHRNKGRQTKIFNTAIEKSLPLLGAELAKQRAEEIERSLVKVFDNVGFNVRK